MPEKLTMLETKTASVNQTLNIGIGAIGPAPHIAAGEYSKDLIERAERDVLLDESLFKPVEIGIPVQCADGRTIEVIGGSAIGGSFTAVMADALGEQLFLRPDMSAPEHAELVYDFLISRRQSIGGHDDEHAGAENCGCGGMDKLMSIDPDTPSILGFFKL